MVEFLKDVKGEDFTFEKGKRYVSMNDSSVSELKDKILIRQPNSPKKENWWASFSKEHEGLLFKTVDEKEMPIWEEIEENEALQL